MGVHNCWDLGRTNSPTLTRRGDDLRYRRIWATPPRRLVFWNGTSSPSIGIRAMPRTQSCVWVMFDDVDLPMAQRRNGPAHPTGAKGGSREIWQWCSFVLQGDSLFERGLLGFGSNKQSHVGFWDGAPSSPCTWALFRNTRASSSFCSLPLVTVSCRSCPYFLLDFLARANAREKKLHKVFQLDCAIYAIQIYT